MDFGVTKTLSGSSVVGLPTAEIAALTGVTEVEEAVVSARPGVTPAQLVDSLRSVVDGDVITGDKRRTDLANGAHERAI